VPVGASHVRWRGLIDRETQKRAAHAANLIERNLILKQAVGFMNPTSPASGTCSDR
jgi:hypothetical protein